MQNFDNKDDRKIIIEHAVATDQSNLKIVANENNYYGDDPLEYAYQNMKECKNFDILKNQYNVIKLLIKKDLLKTVVEKKKIDRSMFYDRIFELIDEYIDQKISEEDILKNIIDDGYLSILYSVVGIGIICRDYIEEERIILLNNCKDLFCELSSTTLNIKYSRHIKDRKQLVDAENLSIKLEDKLKRITSVNQFYNIYNFNYVQINNLKSSEIGFINEEIKYRVTTGIIPNLIKPLYGNNPECGARELIQNATDACKERLLNDAMYTPRIDITYNEDSIIIKDNGIGMDINIIRNNYFNVGNSSKKTGNLVGQFGIGSLASFLLGDSILVKTRRYGTTDILKFKYILANNDDYLIDVFIEQDPNFEFGTEVEIELNDSLKKQDLLRILKLKEWYLTSEVPIYINNNKIRSVENDRFEWIEFTSDSENFSAKFLYNKNDWDENIDIDGKIIYNGILLSDKYSIENKYYYKGRMKSYPCINVIDNGTKRKMEINLERSKFTNAYILINELRDSIYLKEFDFLKNSSPLQINKKKSICDFIYDGTLITDIPIIYSAFGANLDSVITRGCLYKKGVKKIWILYNCRNINFSDLDERYAYIFVNRNTDKSFIGEKLLNQSTEDLYVYCDFMERYFFDADSWNVGLKTDALKTIYTNYNYLQVDNQLSPTKFWEQHNQHKTFLRQSIMSNGQESYCKIKDCSKSATKFIENIYAINKNAVIECQDILYTNIMSYYDELFLRVFHDDSFIWKWTE